MASLVLTMIGNDQAGLVHAVADIVRRHGGNWERSQLAELGNKFAGIVLVTVPDANIDALTADLGALHGVIDVDVHPIEERTKAGRTLVLELLGNDRVGIVSDVTDALRHRGVNLESFDATTRDAPMGGGRLFEARAVLSLDDAVDIDDLTAGLDSVANDLMVDLTLTETPTT